MTAQVLDFRSEVRAAVKEWMTESAGGGQRSGDWRTGYRHDAPGAPSPVGYAHGPGGILTYPGVDPDVFHTVIGTLPGVLNELPTRASVYADPVYEVITGIRADVGDEKDAVCDAPPTGGLMKAGKVTAPFGRYERQTREIELNRLGLLNDRADPMDLRLMGTMAGSTGIGRFPQPGATGPMGNPLINEIAKALLERAVSFHRLLTRQLWTGNPANNSAGGGYKELTGLSLLVNTGNVDAERNIALPALDSDVKDFNYARVDVDGDGLVNALTYMFRYVRSIAARTGVEPVRWVWAMREEAFYEITKVWPCAYYLGGCTVVDADGQRLNIDARDQIELRDQMRSGRFLLMDGIRVDVILDDGIAELSQTDSNRLQSGDFASDIYLLPMSVLGGTATLFLEYFDMSNASLQSALGTGLLPGVVASGAWMEGAERTRQCVQYWAKIEPRLVLRTPWLAGRLRNVAYRPLQHTRTPFPGDPYNVNGGLTWRDGPSLYGPPS